MIAGRYALDREIGRGGMGAVWLARDEVLGRRVALKRVGMLPGTGPGADLARAEREARLAARLNHPHVVAVFDLAREDGQLWLVMEYVEGSTLADLVRDHGALSPERAAAALAQVADALTAAHATGIVHRDVKPSNILLTPDGHVKLSDFGIARAQTDVTLTETGLVTGSPAYLAPEVASGSTATAASDVWSLGATLFHALAGRPPYEVSDNVLGALYRIVHEEPPRLADAGWLGPLLERTMAKEPGERWPMTRVRDFLAAGPGAPVGASPSVATPPAPSSDDGTRLLTAAGPRVPLPPPPSRPPAPAGATAASSGRAGVVRGRPTLLAVLGAVAVVAVLVVAVLATVTRDDSGTPRADTTSAATGGTPTGRSSAAAPPQRPTARGMAAFVEDYLTTAATDPRAGFRMLTPKFQAESGDLDGYLSFWGDVTRVEDIVVTGTDVDRLTVAYTYTYHLSNGSPRTEDVRLELEYVDGRYLIDGEA